MKELYLVALSKKSVVHTVKGMTATIGRLDSNDVTLSESTVSKLHAVLFFDPATGQTVVRDLNSTNGTSRNGNAFREQQIEHGDEVFFGTAGYVFRIVDSHHPKSETTQAV